MNTNKKNSKQNLYTSHEKLKSNVTSLFLAVLVFIFPLMVFDAYFDILEAKFFTYSAIMLSLFCVLAILYVYNSIKWKKFWLSETKTSVKQFFLHKNNVFAVVFLCVAIISTLSSTYKEYAFWGTAGRYSGLFLIVIYIVSYLIISSVWIFNEKVIYVFLASSLLVMLLGVMDYFRIDFLNLRINVHALDKDIFVSTIGNINSYTAYVVMVLALTCTLFVLETSMKKSIVFFVLSVIGFVAGITGRSDSLYLALFALFAILPFFALNSTINFRKYLLLVLAFLVALKGVVALNINMPEKVIPIDGVLITFTNSILFYAALILVIIAIIVLFRFKINYNVKKIKITWLCMLLVFFAVFIFILIDANFLGNEMRYNAFANYLVFNDEWGSLRGVIWRSSFEVFAGFSFIQKLIGFGPDTFILLMSETDAMQTFLQSGIALDNAHNEYIHYMLTVGLLGLVAYIGFLVLTLKQIYTIKHKNIYAAACFVAAVCYIVQAFVNLNLPTVTPVFYLLLAFGASVGKLKN